MFRRRTLKLLGVIVGITALVVIPAIVLNYQGIGKPYTGAFTLIFINMPIGLFINGGVTMVTGTGTCGPVAYCDVTVTGWLLVVLFWLAVAWALAWLLSAVLERRA